MHTSFARASSITSIRGFCRGLCAACLVCAPLISTSAAAEVDGETVATFNGGRITRADLESVIANKLPDQRALIAREGVRPVLESLIRWDLLVKEAEARGYADQATVQEAVKSQKVEQLVAAATHVEPASFSEAELARALEPRRLEFQRARMRRATYIVVAQQAEAVALISELKHATREQFAQAARDRSIDLSSRNQGGELGYFDQDGKNEKGQPAHGLAPLTKAAFGLKRVGDVSPEPIALSNGFAVLMLTGEMAAYTAPPGQVDELLREGLLQTKQKAALEALVKELSAKAQPVVHAELIGQVVLPEIAPLGIPEGFPAAPPDPRVPPKTIAPDRY
jgi:hypothetical protein